MKQTSRVVAIFFLFFSFSIITSARLLHLPQRNELMKAIETSPPADSSMQIQEDDLFNGSREDLVEVECDEKDEDCVKRRVIAEAHLDYIYTQSIKPKKPSP